MLSLEDEVNMVMGQYLGAFEAAQVYPGVPFTRYTILGDNIIIRDERVAECYRELIPPLNVPFSLEKSLVSSVGALEFGASSRVAVSRLRRSQRRISFCPLLQSMLWPSSLWALNLDTSSGPSCMDLGLLNGFAEDRIPYPMSLARLLGTFGLGFLRPI
ncbi:hypothetical protein T459_27551 [Capsicum annuum]|uniref:Uncharacterized protein n=1 Tax=Capsicum annuum TaxID=4072 RepID=A0A2G2YE86_CAPAN|nr:hypothetical protein T459_27551 [Capsicum annuum]